MLTRRFASAVQRSTQTRRGFAQQVFAPRENKGKTVSRHFDTVGSLCNSLRMASKFRRLTTTYPNSRMARGILSVLMREGYISNYVVHDKPYNYITIHLRYSPDTGRSAINKLKQMSKPGLRVFKPWKSIKPFEKGLGTTIVSTPQGVLTDQQCWQARVGGEILFGVF